MYKKKNKCNACSDFGMEKTENEASHSSGIFFFLLFGLIEKIQ